MLLDKICNVDSLLSPIINYPSFFNPRTLTHNRFLHKPSLAQDWFDHNLSSIGQDCWWVTN